jgi:DNA-binding Lrp family transcriptional regulator
VISYAILSLPLAPLFPRVNKIQYDKDINKSAKKLVKLFKEFKNMNKLTNLMDDKDKLILFELQQDCRQPLSKIAKSVKLPQQTVSYRIKKLEDEKVIKKYTININYPKLGYSRHSLYLDLRSIDATEVNDYLKHLTGMNEVSCCYMLHGVSQWKVYVSVWTKTIERYDEIQTKIITKFRKHLKNYLSFQSVKSWSYFGRILNPNKKAKVDTKESPGNFVLREMEQKLLDKLRKNGNASVVELARELKTTHNTIIRKIKYLKENGIIERFYPILDVNKLGLKEYTFISRIDLSYSKDLNKFIEYAKEDPRFCIVIKAVGYVNLYYAFYSKNDNELKEITSKIDKFLGKAALETYKIEVEEMIS